MADWRDTMPDPRTAGAGVVVQNWATLGPIYATGDGRFYAIRNGQREYVPAYEVMQGYSWSGTPDAHGQRPDTPLPSHNNPWVTTKFNPKTGRQEQDIDWGVVLGTVGAGGILGAGAAAAAGGAGGGGTLASSPWVSAGTLPEGAASGAVPAAFGGVDAAAVGAGAAGGTGALASSPWASAGMLPEGAASGGMDAAGTLASSPWAGAGTLPSGAPSGAVPEAMSAVGGSGSALAKIMKNAAGKDGWLGPALATAAGLGGYALSNHDSPYQQSFDELLKLMLGRIKNQEPLQQAINTQALGGLPDYARGGK